jgi:predicted component of type VI protein secretion system
MPNARALAGSHRMAQCFRDLRDHWLATESTWSDSVRQRFEERYLTPIESAVQSAVNGIQTMAEILEQVRRDCSDRSELL